MAMEIFKLVGSVFVDTDEADKSLKKTDKNAGGLGSKLLSAGKAAGKFAAGVAAGAAAAGAALIGVAENTREYRIEQGKLEAAFKTAGFEGDVARQTYEALNGVLGDSGQAVEAANHLALLCDSEEELATMTEAMTGIYATFGDSLPLEGLAEAANETAKTGAVTGSLADALNWVSLGSEGWRAALEGNQKALKAFSRASHSGATNEEAFTAALQACSNEQERQALITQTLNVAYGDAAAAYREVNGEVIAANVAQDNLNNAMAGVGAAVEPFLTMGKQLLADVLTQLTPVLASLAETIIPVLSSAVSSLAEFAIPLLSDAITWVANTVLPPLTEALSAIGGWFDSIKTKLSDSGITFETVMSTVQTLFSGAMTFLQGIWTTVGQPVWDLIKQNIELIAGLFQEHMPAIQNFVSQAFTDIKNIWEQNLRPALDAIGKFIENVLAPAFKFVFETIIEPVVEGAFSGIVALWDGVLKPALQGILDFVTDVFSGDFSGAFSGLVDTISSIWDGLGGVIKAPLNTVIGIVNSFISKINNLQIPEWVPGIGGKGLDIPSIPYMEQGGVLEKGQIGFLEGRGAEAVVPLHRNKEWISKVAEDMDNAVGGASGSQMVSMLSTISQQLEAIKQMGLYIDGDKLVGGIGGKMDKHLGQIQARKARA
jgi:hypothetical protein